MKPPLRIVPGYPNRLTIRIVDDSNAVIAIIPASEREFAEKIVRRFGQPSLRHWWYRDAKQRAYDKWVGERNEAKAT